MDLEGPPPIPGTFDDAHEDDSRIPFSDEEDQSFDCENLPIPDHDPTFFSPPQVKTPGKSDVSSQSKEMVKEDSPGLGNDHILGPSVETTVTPEANSDLSRSNAKEDQSSLPIEEVNKLEEQTSASSPVLDVPLANSDQGTTENVNQHGHASTEIKDSTDLKPISEQLEAEKNEFSSFAEAPMDSNVSNDDELKLSVVMDTPQTNGTDHDNSPATITKPPPSSEDDFADFVAADEVSSNKNLEDDCGTSNVFTDSSETNVNKLEKPILEAPKAVSNGFSDDDDDDEFGDFADFAQAEPTATSDNEWGDFDSAPRNSRQVSVANLESEDDDDGFGAFGSAANTSETADKDETDWSADFKQSSSFSAGFAPTFEEKNDYPALETMDLTSIWEFDDNDDLEEDSGKVIHITSEFDCNTVDDSTLSSDDFYYSSCQIWHALRIVEDSKALEFKWDSSVVNSNFLKRLEIDENCPPTTLQPLSVKNVLQPTPVTMASGTSSGNQFLHKPAVSPSTLSPSPVFSQTNKENASPRATTPDHSPTVNLDSLSAPPVDFDWNKSGLTNPLKGGNRSSALLDVDFLSLNSGNTVNSVSTLQKELDALGLSTPTPSENTSSQQSVLDRLMATTAPQKHNYRPSAELSLDAGALHAQLPEIGYLRSKTIMFPIGPLKQSQEQ